MSTRNWIIVGVVCFVGICLAISALAIGVFIFWQPVMHYRAQEMVAEGKALAKAGDSKGAMADYQQAVQIDPHDLQAYIALGFAHIMARQFNDALAVGDAAIAANPRKDTGYLIRGYAHECLKNFSEARNDYDGALRLNPNAGYGHARRGIVLLVLHDNAEALEEFNEGIRLSPHLAVAYAYRGRLKLEQHDNDSAVSDEAKAVELEPKNVTYLEDQALVALYTGDDKLAEQACTAALELSPRAYSALYDMSAVHRHAGDSKGAMDYINQAIAVEPKGAAYFDRGFIKYDLGDMSGARADFVLARNSSHRAFVELWIWMADTRQGNRGEADRELDVYLDSARRIKDGLWTEKLGDVLLGRVTAEAVAAGPNPEATEIGQNNNICDLWFYAAQLARAKGDEVAVRDDLRKAIATNAVGEIEFYEAKSQLKAMSRG